MADSQHPEPESKQHSSRAESKASSLSDSSNKKLVFAAHRFNSLQWTTVHKFITEYCDVQLHPPTNSKIPELYDSLDDMIKDAFTGDLLPDGETVLKTYLPDLSTDKRLRSFKWEWLSDFNFVKTVDSAVNSKKREEFRRLQSSRTESIARKFRELNLTDRTPSELIIMKKFKDFIRSYLYLLGRNLTSEDSYRKCLEKFLEALFLQTLSPPAKRWQYLRPAIAWSYSGKIVAEPVGTVITEKCVDNFLYKPFAYLEVKRPRETKCKKLGDSARCLKDREAKPRVPWRYVQEVLDGVLPQHFLELLLSADDTVFETEKKEGCKLQSYLTKVGLIQQGMLVNVIILKICEEDFWWLVPGEEKGEKLHKEYNASIRSRDCPEATESVPSEEGAGPETENSKIAISSWSDEDNEDDLTLVAEEINNDESITTKEFIRSLRSARSQKKVRFKDLDLDDDSGSERTPAQLYISKTYSLLNNQERTHLANGLLVLETLADNIISYIVQ